MLDGSVHVSVLGVRLGELSVRFRALRGPAGGLALLVCFLRDLQEFVQELDGLNEVSLSLIDVSNFLVAFGFLRPVLSPLRGIEALFEKLERLLEIVLLLLLQGDCLVHSDELFADLLLQLDVVAILSLAQSGY